MTPVVMPNARLPLDRFPSKFSRSCIPATLKTLSLNHAGERHGMFCFAQLKVDPLDSRTCATTPLQGTRVRAENGVKNSETASFSQHNPGGNSAGLEQHRKINGASLTDLAAEHLIPVPWTNPSNNTSGEQM